MDGLRSCEDSEYPISFMPSDEREDNQACGLTPFNQQCLSTLMTNLFHYSESIDAQDERGHRFASKRPLSDSNLSLKNIRTALQIHHSDKLRRYSVRLHDRLDCERTALVCAWYSNEVESSVLLVVAVRWDSNIRYIFSGEKRHGYRRCVFSISPVRERRYDR